MTSNGPVLILNIALISNIATEKPSQAGITAEVRGGLICHSKQERFEMSSLDINPYPLYRHESSMNVPTIGIGLLGLTMTVFHSSGEVIVELV